MKIDSRPTSDHQHSRPGMLMLRRKGEEHINILSDRKLIPDTFVRPMSGLIMVIKMDGVLDNLNSLPMMNATHIPTRKNRLGKTLPNCGLGVKKCLL